LRVEGAFSILVHSLEMDSVKAGHGAKSVLVAAQLFFVKKQPTSAAHLGEGLTSSSKGFNTPMPMPGCVTELYRSFALANQHVLSEVAPALTVPPRSASSVAPKRESFLDTSAPESPLPLVCNDLRITTTATNSIIFSAQKHKT